MEDWRIRQKEAQIAHRMLGLLSHAGAPRYVDISDHLELVKAVRSLCKDLREQRRRGAP
jgi:alpha-D-ribose 1-methylphosphonate 5-triphosphate synthase subunit PhnI